MLDIHPLSPHDQLLTIEQEEQRQKIAAAEVHIAENDENGRYGRFIIEPLEVGYGYTLGNAMKRVLTRNVPGVAVSSIKVLQLRPEDKKIPGVEETLLDVILNVRKVVVSSESKRPQKATLEAVGQSKFTAGDIRFPEEVTLVNPEAHCGGPHS